MSKGITKKSHERALKALLLLDRPREKRFIVKSLYGHPTESNFANFNRDIFFLISSVATQTTISPDFKGNSERSANLRRKFREAEREYGELAEKEGKLSEEPDNEQLRRKVADAYGRLRISKIPEIYSEKSVYRKGKKKFLLIDKRKLLSLWSRGQKRVINEFLDSPQGRHLHFLSGKEDRKHRLIDSLSKSDFMHSHVKLFLLKSLISRRSVDEIPQILGRGYSFAIAKRAKEIAKISSERASLDKGYGEFMAKLAEYAEFLSMLRLEPENINAMDYSINSIPSVFDEWECYSVKK